MICTENVGYTPIAWDSKFSVGAWEIDNQHRKLMTYYNGAIMNCSGDAVTEKEYFNNTIDDFIDFLSKHFATEEQVLYGKYYFQYDEHKLDHVKLLEKIRFVTREVQNDRWEMKLYILAITLKDWLMYHFETYDASAKEHFRDEAGIEVSGVSNFAFQR